MWHGQGKPLISNFFLKILRSMPMRKKNSTRDWEEVRKNLTKVCLGLTTWNYSILVFELQRSLCRPQVTSPSLPSFLLSKWSSSKLRQVFSHLASGVFSHAWTWEFSRKTWNQRFFSPVSHLVFIVLWVTTYKLDEDMNTKQSTLTYEITFNSIYLHLVLTHHSNPLMLLLPRYSKTFNFPSWFILLQGQWSWRPHPHH